MDWRDFDCPNCKKEFEVYCEWQSDVTCPHCKKVYDLEFDEVYNEDGDEWHHWWLGKEVIKEEAK